MGNKQKIQEIRTERAENNKRILKLKQEICELENLSPDYKYNHIEPEENRNKYFACSFVMGLGAILGEVIGGLIGQMGNNVLLGLLLVLPFTAIPAFGAVYGFVKAIKLNKVKDKKVKDNSQLENELNLKYEELEKLEAYDHNLYTQLTQELSKSDGGTLKNYNKYKLTTDNSSWTIDEYEDIKEV